MVQFGSWLVTSKRAGSNPFSTLSQPRVVENRHRRRILGSGDLRRLIAATRNSTRTFRGLSGEDRSLLYATAYYTAFRAGGVASLTPECFHLEDPIPAVTLPVRGNKARRELINAMPADLVDALRVWLEGKQPGEPVWSGPWAAEKLAASMLRSDLAEAEIPYIVEGPNGPEHADFHSLRHTSITTLRRSGGDLRAQQAMAGHSSPVVTARYSQVDLRAKADEVNKLPTIMPEAGSSTASAYVPLTFAPDSGGGFVIGDEDDTPTRPDKCDGCNPLSEVALDSGRGLSIAGEEVHQTGLEPVTFGSVDRCSIQLSYWCVNPSFVVLS